jgi:hypothetical protein
MLKTTRFSGFDHPRLRRKRTDARTHTAQGVQDTRIWGWKSIGGGVSAGFWHPGRTGVQPKLLPGGSNRAPGVVLGALARQTN